MTKTIAQTKRVQNFAVIGAGMAGIACARTLMQAGHRVTVFEKSKCASGRMATRSTSFGSFDHGAQYFTVRDQRFSQALATTPHICKPWSANAVRVLDAMGRVIEAARNTQDKHWVATPGMNALVKAWAQPLVQNDTIHFESKVFKIERDTLHPELWQLHSEEPEGAQSVFSGFDQVLLAIPSNQAIDLLRNSKIKMEQAKALDEVQVAPSWTLMLAFPNAVQPGLITLGPQWNAARSVHHRVAWLARESSKPGRQQVERWTVQASAAWSQEHLEDAPDRVQAKLIKAFSEITGIRATPAHASVHCWRYAKTLQPLGATHMLSKKQGIGLCGDWCIGHRVEDAFVSGLELALDAL
jgi:predicted NAD/FAD-dependent oxidoreductase